MRENNNNNIHQNREYSIVCANLYFWNVSKVKHFPFSSTLSGETNEKYAKWQNISLLAYCLY